MCGRFSLFIRLLHLQLRFESFEDIGYKERYNISPGQTIVAVTNDGEKNHMNAFFWGFYPRWEGNEGGVRQFLINARGETAAKLPTFRQSFRDRRCLIPADGFYEWKDGGKTKAPYYFKMKNNEPFGIAGIWSPMEAHGKTMNTALILTTAPNEVVQGIHHRMPAIIRKEDEKSWMNPKNRDYVGLQDMLQPYPAEEMEQYPVTIKVNDAKKDTPEMVKPLTNIESPDNQKMLGEF